MLTHDSIVRQFITAFNEREIERALGYFRDDALLHGVLDGSLANARQCWKNLIEVFDITYIIEDIVADDCLAAVRLTETGVFQNTFGKHKPTGKRYSVLNMQWFRIDSGQIVERWSCRDLYQVAQQVGIPSPECPTLGD